jgi:hypothetical protein
MTLKIEEIEALPYPSSPRRSRRTRSRGRFSPTRRDFLRTAIGTGMGIGLAAVGALPMAKPARAHHGSWSIKQDCSGLSYAQGDNCDGCDLPGSPACCCTSAGFYDGGTCRRKHRPGECKPGTNRFDGWKWSTGDCCRFNCGDGECNCRTNREWRCTDGWKRHNCSDPFSRTTDLRICRHVLNAGTGCDCR